MRIDLPMSTATVRTFNDLSAAEQATAVDLAYAALLQDVVEGNVRFSDALNDDDLQARIDAAWGQGRRDAHAVWFAGEYVHEAAGDELRGMAQCDAEDALYVNPEVRVVQLPT